MPELSVRFAIKVLNKEMLELMFEPSRIDEVIARFLLMAELIPETSAIVAMKLVNPANEPIMNEFSAIVAAIRRSLEIEELTKELSLTVLEYVRFRNNPELIAVDSRMDETKDRARCIELKIPELSAIDEM